MVRKKTGISLDLIIHPGETISEVLEERSISQTELAERTGVSKAYVSNVIAGKKDISANFAYSLEYALGVPKSFWLNLQANYDAELLEFNELKTITEDERAVHAELKDIVKYLKSTGSIPKNEDRDSSILSVRKALQISNLTNLKNISPVGLFRMANTNVNSYVLGAWIRLCQNNSKIDEIHTQFDINHIDQMISDLKEIMVNDSNNIQEDLHNSLANYGIDFSIVKNFNGAPVQGYISLQKNGRYQMAMTLRRAYADIFWFSLFHELGHLHNGDVTKTKFLDDGSDIDKEKSADLFAQNNLMNHNDYQKFLLEKDFSIKAIKEFAKSQHIMPYIVIGRLQKENYLKYSHYNEYKLRYKWSD